MLGNIGYLKSLFGTVIGGGDKVRPGDVADVMAEKVDREFADGARSGWRLTFWISDDVLAKLSPKATEALRGLAGEDLGEGGGSGTPISG